MNTSLDQFSTRDEGTTTIALRSTAFPLEPWNLGVARIRSSQHDKKRTPLCYYNQLLKLPNILFQKSIILRLQNRPFTPKKNNRPHRSLEKATLSQHHVPMYRMSSSCYQMRCQNQAIWMCGSIHQVQNKALSQVRTAAGCKVINLLQQSPQECDNLHCFAEACQIHKLVSMPVPFERKHRLAFSFIPPHYSCNMTWLRQRLVRIDRPYPFHLQGGIRRSQALSAP